MRIKQFKSLRFYFYLAVILCQLNISAQTNNKDKYSEKYYTHKKKYRGKESLVKIKDKVKDLGISYYGDSVFPNEFILKFTNLQELWIIGPIKTSSILPLKYDEYKIIKFDTTNLKKLVGLKKLTIQLFNFKEFPKELSQIPNLKKLIFFETTLNQIPKEISEFKSLTELDLLANCAEYIDTSINQLKNLEMIKVENNKLKSIPNAFVNANNIKHFTISNNLGPMHLGFNFNRIDFYNEDEIDKLKKILLHSTIVISVLDCKEGKYLKAKIGKELCKNLFIVYDQMDDCSD